MIIYLTIYFKIKTFTVYFLFFPVLRKRENGITFPILNLLSLLTFFHLKKKDPPLTIFIFLASRDFSNSIIYPPLKWYLQGMRHDHFWYSKRHTPKEISELCQCVKSVLHYYGNIRTFCCYTFNENWQPLNNNFLLFWDDTFYGRWHFVAFPALFLT